MGLRQWLAKQARTVAQRIDPVPADVRPSQRTQPGTYRQGYQQGYTRRGPYPGGYYGDSDAYGAVSIDPATREAMAAQGMTLGGAWTPGEPIDPFNQPGTPPRQWEYPIGYNIVQLPRSTEAIGFDTLRQFLYSYDWARICIETIQDYVRLWEWDIVAKNEADAGKYQSEIDALRRFFEYPDGVTPWEEWIVAAVEQQQAYDALSIFRRRTRGGKMGALELVDGTTVTPLIDEYGHPPAPPAPAYVQWWQGMPWVWLTRDELLYRPYRPRADSPYGVSPLEAILLNINTDIRLQWHFLLTFTEGTVPDIFLTAPPDVSDPEQIRRWQELYDAVMAGDQAWKHKARILPHGTQVTNVKDTSPFNWDFASWLATKTVAAFKLTPAEVGLTERVNKSSGETQENVTYRKLIKPLARFYEGLLNEIIAKDFGLPVLRFTFLNVVEEEDRLTDAQVKEILVRNAVLSPDEWREELGYKVDPAHPVGRVFVTRTGVAAPDDALALGHAQVAQAAAKAGLMPSAGGRVSADATAPTTQADAAVPPEVDPVYEQLPVSGGATAPTQKLAKRAQREPPVRRDSAIYTAYLEALARRLRRALRQQAQRVSPVLARAIRQTRAEHPPGAPPSPVAVEAVLAAADWQPLAEAVRAAVEPWLQRAFATAAEEGLAHVQAAWEGVNAAATAYAAQRAAELVGLRRQPDGTWTPSPRPGMAIPETTRQLLRATIRDAIASEQDTEALIQTLKAHYAFSDARAETIARTELAQAYNRGNLAAWRATGTEFVHVFDGDSDAECQEADGQIWTVDEADANPTSHPNCVRSFAPVTKGTLPAGSLEPVADTEGE